MHQATLAAILAEHRLRSEQVNREAWKGQSSVPGARERAAGVLVALAAWLASPTSPADEAPRPAASHT